MATTRSPRSPVKSASPCHDEASGKSDVARAPTPNVARAPLCPAMTRSGMTVRMANRFITISHSIDTTIIALRTIAGHRGTDSTFCNARLLDFSPARLPNDGDRNGPHQAIALGNILAGLVGRGIAGALPEQVTVIQIEAAATEAKRREKRTKPVHLILTCIPRESSYRNIVIIAFLYRQG